MSPAAKNVWLGYAASAGATLLCAVLLWFCYPLLQDVTTAGVLLILVLLIANRWGTGPALVCSVMSGLILNFYYIEPKLRLGLRLAQGSDLVELVTFVFASLFVGQLSALNRRRANENQRLYERLRTAFREAAELEGARQSERFKTALLDAVSHDLRTPLATIKAAATAFVDIREVHRLPNDVAADSKQRLLSIIIGESDRLNHVIEGLLELARVESGGQVLPASGPEDLPAEDIVANALARAESKLKPYTVRVECEETLPPVSNPRAISQVLYSLLENAARYAPPASEVCVRVSRAGDSRVRFAVEDVGPGVPAEVREKVFQKFFRTDGPPPVDGDGIHALAGIGLGLAIARGIVEGHGGRIWIDPAYAAGARFVFEWPQRHPLSTASPVQAAGGRT